MLAKIYANLTLAYVKLHAPDSGAMGRSVAFNSANSVVFLGGFTKGSLDGQAYSGGLADFYVSAWFENGTRFLTTFAGSSSGEDYVNDIIPYQSGAVYAGYNMYGSITLLRLNGSLITSRLTV